MADNTQQLSDELKKSFEALSHPGEPGERSPIIKWRGMIYVTVKYLLSTINKFEKKFGDLNEWLNRLEGGEHPEGVTSEAHLAVQVVEIAIAKLEPGPDDVVVFWLPSNAGLTHAQVKGIADSFGGVIKKRFRFIVLIRQSVDIEIIGGVLLPS